MMTHTDGEGISVTIKKRYLVIFFLCLLLPWLCLWFFVRSNGFLTSHQNEHFVATGAETNTFHCKIGPWGELDYLRIFLEPPSELNPAWRNSPEKITWKLNNLDEPKYRELLARCNFTTGQIEEFYKCTRPDPSIHGFEIQPNDNLLFGMSSDQRTALYSFLGKMPGNPAQNFPTRIHVDTFMECRKKAHLTDDEIKLMENLTYSKSQQYALFDLEAFLSKLSSKEKRKVVWACMTQQPTLLVRMKITTEMDIDSIARYWGKEGYDKDVKPILNAVAEHPTESYLSIQYLLPPFARVRLFTYPSPSDKKTDGLRDCTWTALNFFQDFSGNDDYTKPEVVRKRLTKDYYPIVDEPTLGDIAMLTTTTGEFIHMAVFVADNIYFTKNGASLYSPWVLVELNDIIEQYSIEGPVVLKYYRLKSVDG